MSEHINVCVISPSHIISGSYIQPHMQYTHVHCAVYSTKLIEHCILLLLHLYNTNTYNEFNFYSGDVVAAAPVVANTTTYTINIAVYMYKYILG